MQIFVACSNDDEYGEYGGFSLTILNYSSQSFTGGKLYFGAIKDDKFYVKDSLKFNNEIFSKYTAPDKLIEESVWGDGKYVETTVYRNIEDYETWKPNLDLIKKTSNRGAFLVKIGTKQEFVSEFKFPNPIIGNVSIGIYDLNGSNDYRISKSNIYKLSSDNFEIIK